ncbi:MAG: hypothetical protein ACLFO6_00715 [Archaeoglobaceae archaeon]
MQITPLAFDSFGARSMCTFVGTDDVKVIIDPAVALGPKRYNLSPHPLELQKKGELWEKIKEYTAKSEVAVFTHYHYDHHNPDEPEMLNGKKVLAKHTTQKINKSQMNRGKYFLKQLGYTESVEFADGRSYQFGDTIIVVSPPVFHGTSEKLGYVIEVLIDDGEQRFLYSSDVEGPSIPAQIDFMIESDPHVVIIDGPMTYMLGFRYSQKALQESVNNLKKLIDNTEVKNLVLDHHLTRDLNWREKINEVISKGEDAGVEVQSAAEFAGIKENLLEARRKELYQKYPPEKK